jgi:hypothetical protein
MPFREIAVGPQRVQKTPSEHALQAVDSAIYLSGVVSSLRQMSAYSVVTIICLLEESLAKRHAPVNSFSSHLINTSSDSVVSFSLAQLHSLAALLNELGDQSRPSGLVARSDASAIVAMKVLMEIDEVAPVWIVLKFLEPAINWPMSIV